jgi:hypothetical protein
MPSQIKVESVQCPETLPYWLVKVEKSWSHVVVLPTDTIEKMETAIEPRLLNTEHRGVILARNIHSKRRYKCKDDALLALRDFIEVYESDNGLLVSKRDRGSSQTTDAPVKPRFRFCLHAEDKGEWWLPVVTVEG